MPQNCQQSKYLIFSRSARDFSKKLNSSTKLSVDTLKSAALCSRSAQISTLFPRVPRGRGGTMKGTFAAVVGILALTLLATTARAQILFGSIVGTVNDSADLGRAGCHREDHARVRRAWGASALRRGGFGPCDGRGHGVLGAGRQPDCGAGQRRSSGRVRVRGGSAR